MKTDRFADSIRRKLDSIRPEFSERDWERMQATLNQASPTLGTPTPSAHPFAGYTAKLAAAGLVGTTIFLSTTIWQHYELKHLHQTLQQVTQKAVRPTTDSLNRTTPLQTESNSIDPASDRLVVESQRPAEVTQREAAPGTSKRDTVYIDRYITVPAPTTRLQTTDNPRLANQLDRQPADNPSVRADASDAIPKSDNSARNQTQRQGTNRFEAPGAGIMPSDEAVVHQERTSSRSGRQINNQERVSENVAHTFPSGDVKHRNAPLRSGETAANTDGSGASGATAPVSTNSDRPDRITYNEPPASGSADVAQPSMILEPLTALPMQSNTVHWDALLAQRARRMRPARTTVVSGQASAAPTVQRVQAIPVQLRAGLGADVSSQMYSLGAYAEVVAFKHWSLGIGLNQAKFGTSFFPSIPDFDRNSPQDFRKQYARGMDPRFEIVGIQLYTKRVQLPINLGYRIPVSSSLAILPTVGTDLTLQSRQYISFYQQLPYRMGYEKVDIKSIRPSDLFTNVTFGASLEWQTNHWAAQAGPLITSPLQSDPGCQQNTSVGLRARLYYQF